MVSAWLSGETSVGLFDFIASKIGNTKEKRYSKNNFQREGASFVSKNIITERSVPFRRI